MEYKKVQYWYNTIKGAIKEIGKSLCYNFISGGPYAGDGFSSKRTTIEKWDGKISYEKVDKKKTIDNKF